MSFEPQRVRPECPVVNGHNSAWRCPGGGLIVDLPPHGTTDDHRRAGGEEDDAGHAEADRDRHQVVQLATELDVGAHVGHGVGVHDHDHPVARLEVPGDGLRGVTRRLGDPEGLVHGW